MFGEISLMAWMGGAIVFAIGGAAGFFIARQIKDKRTLQLEQQLESTQNKLTEYQGEVNRHFLKTSLLFNKLTDNYREVYDHLATGAQTLCNEKPHTAALDLPDTKILAAAPAAATETPAHARTETTGQAPEHPRESTDNPADMDTVATVEAAPDMATSTEQTASKAASGNAEQRTEEDNAPATKATAETAAKATDHGESAEKAESPATTTRATEHNSNTPSPSKAELKALEANEKKKSEEEEVHLGAESTPGVELEHHKTHPRIH